MNRLLRRVRLAMLLLLPLQAAAESPQTLAERQLIAEQRATIEADYTRGERDCQQEFAVTACVNRLREQRREALAALRERELQLDDARRRAEVAAQRQRLADKAAANAARPPPAPASSAEAQAPPAPRSPPSAKPRAPRPAPAPAAISSAPSLPTPGDAQRKAAQRAEEAKAAAERVQAQQRRASEAAAHREAVQRRNAQRAASGKQAAPLPVPASAAAR